MRAFYYLFVLFNNLLSIHIHTCGEKKFFFGGGGLAPKPLMSAAYDAYTVVYSWGRPIQPSGKSTN